VEKIFIATKNSMGNPANAVAFLFDKDIPIWIRVSMLGVGVLCWTCAILALLEKQ